MRAFTHLYEVLGLDPDQEIITQEDIKKAYRAKARECHPDKEGGSEERMIEVNNAWEILGDPNLRAKYDATGIGDKQAKKTEIKGAELLHQMLQQVLTAGGPGGMMAAIVGQKSKGYKDFTHSSLVDALRKMCDKAEAGVKEQIEEHKEGVAYFDKLIAKLERKKGSKGPDVLTGMLNAQRSSHADAVAQGNEALEEVAAVLELLETYDFSFTPPAPPPAPRGYGDLRGMGANFVIFDDPYRPAGLEYIMPKEYFHQQPEQPIVLDRAACIERNIADPVGKCVHTWVPTALTPGGFECTKCGSCGKLLDTKPMKSTWGKENDDYNRKSGRGK